MDVRAGNFGETGDISKYYYSSNWVNVRKHKVIEYHTFDPSMAKEFPSQILYHFEYNPGSRYYPLPIYNGSIVDIQVDIETSKFHFLNLANGLAPSLLINFHEGVPSPEAQNDLYKKIEDKFSGVEGHKLMITFSNDKESAPEIIPLEATTNDDYYLNLDARTKASILSGHQIVSPLLIGIKDSGTGFSSNSDEMLTAWSLWKTLVLSPALKSLLKPMNILMSLYGYPSIELIVEPLNILDSNKTQE